MNAPGVVVGNVNRDFKYNENQCNLMMQKQVAFERAKQQLGALTLSDISPKWLND